MDMKLLAVAGGKVPADIVVKGGKLVNVYTKEIYEGGVAISGDKIAAVGDVCLLYTLTLPTNREV